MFVPCPERVLGCVQIVVFLVNGRLNVVIDRLLGFLYLLLKEEVIFFSLMTINLFTSFSNPFFIGINLSV